MNQLRVPTLGFFFILALLVAFASPAAADPPTVVGSWETTTVNDQGVENVIYETFHYGGTALASGNTRESGGGHGAWEKVGPRTYAVRYIILIFDQKGNLSLKVTTSNSREVSIGGDYAFGVSESRIETADGTFLGTTSKSFTSKRIKP